MAKTKVSISKGWKLVFLQLFSVITPIVLEKLLQPEPDKISDAKSLLVSSDAGVGNFTIHTPSN